MLKLASNKYYTVFQLYPNREERNKNLKGVFYIEDLLKLQNGSTVLLVDDVIAIGSTLSELAKTIHDDRSDLNFRGAIIARNM